MAVYTLLATSWYRATVSLLPVETKNSGGLMNQLGGLSGLAGLAGINLSTSDKAEPLAVLRSNDFARTFIEKNDLLTTVLADKWDAKAGRWTKPGTDIRDGVEYFVKHVIRVGEDRKSSLIVLTVDWTDPETAAGWANKLAMQINEQLRDRAISDAQRSISYLRGELEATNQIALQQSISKLMESQMQNMMVARGNNEYAFRVIDQARVPKKRLYPKRALMTLAAALIGAFLAISWVMLRAPKPERRDSV